jgi:hypothetical protein
MSQTKKHKKSSASGMAPTREGEKKREAEKKEGEKKTCASGMLLLELMKKKRETEDTETETETCPSHRMNMISWCLVEAELSHVAGGLNRALRVP